MYIFSEEDYLAKLYIRICLIMVYGEAQVTQSAAGEGWW